MTELLSIAEWQAVNIRFCPTCAQDTMPLSTGLCGFCNEKIAPNTRQRPVLIEGGRCDCGRAIPTGRAKHCSDSCSDRAAYLKRKRLRAGAAA